MRTESNDADRSDGQQEAGPATSTSRCAQRRTERPAAIALRTGVPENVPDDGDARERKPRQRGMV